MRQECVYGLRVDQNILGVMQVDQFLIDLTWTRLGDNVEVCSFVYEYKEYTF